jgi:hypothetical protein
MKLGQIYVNTRCKSTGKVARYAFNVIKVLPMLARLLRTYFGRLKVTSFHLVWILVGVRLIEEGQENFLFQFRIESDQIRLRYPP